MMYKLEVPVPYSAADNEKNFSKLIDLATKYKERIKCFYIPLGYVMDGLDFWGIRTPDFAYRNGAYDHEAILAWEGMLKDLYAFTGIPFKVLLNNSYIPNMEAAQQRALQAKLCHYASAFNVLSVTVNDVSVVEFVRSLGLQVSLSTNSHNTFPELDAIFCQFGTEAFESIVLQRDLNRATRKLFKYVHERHLQNKIVLMVNEGCVSACPYKTAGDLEISQSDVYSEAPNRTHTYGCSKLAAETPWMFLTSPFMTKPMLDRHTPWVTRVKLSGRDQHIGLVKKMVEHWVDGTDHELHKILNVTPQGWTLRPSDLTDEYMQDVMTCNKECFMCGRCAEHYEKWRPPIDKLVSAWSPIEFSKKL